jgi:hypothetical protein
VEHWTLCEMDAGKGEKSKMKKPKARKMVDRRL